LRFDYQSASGAPVLVDINVDQIPDTSTFNLDAT